MIVTHDHKKAKIRFILCHKHTHTHTHSEVREKYTLRQTLSEVSQKDKNRTYLVVQRIRIRLPIQETLV